MRLFSALFCICLLAGDVSSQDKLEAGKAYFVQGAGAKRTIKLADEWTGISLVDLKSKPGNASWLMIDDVMVSAHLVPVSVATIRAGQPLKGQPGIAITFAISCRTDDKKREYNKWDNARLKDNKDNKYDQIFYQKKLALSEVDGKRVRIDSQSLSESLVFERPVAAATDFYLELPGENLGLKSPFKFKFSAKSVKDAEALGKQFP